MGKPVRSRQYAINLYAYLCWPAPAIELQHYQYLVLFHVDPPYWYFILLVLYLEIDNSKDNNTIPYSN